MAGPEGRSLRWLLALSGLSFAAAAVPADMDDLRAAGSVAHIAASLGVFLFWAPAAWILSRRRGWPALAAVSGLALWAALGAMLLRFTPLPPPGLGQRLSFAVYFGWAAAAAVLLARVRGPLRRA